MVWIHNLFYYEWQLVVETPLSYYDTYHVCCIVLYVGCFSKLWMCWDNWIGLNSIVTGKVSVLMLERIKIKKEDHVSWLVEKRQMENYSQNWVFLPNEQAWIFRWVISVVLPRMFNKSVLAQVKMILSDRDSQEITQIDNTIRMFFPKV